MPAKSERVRALLEQDETGHLQRLHDRLLELGFKARLPSNSKTLLFELGVRSGTKHALAAMRSGYVSVFSFPKTYWSPRQSELDWALSRIAPSHYIETLSFVSESQLSAKQVRISDPVADELRQVVDGLIARHVAALTADP